MRIGIDATALPIQLGGAGYYIVNLIRTLPRIDRENEYIVYTKRIHASLFQSQGRIQVISLSLASRVIRIVWEQTILPWLARQSKLSVLHSPHYTMPLLRSCPTVVTYHDMTFFLYPQLHRLYKRLFFRSIVRLSADRAGAIIAVSDSSRRDILRILKLDAQRVFAIPLGVSEEFRHVDNAPEIGCVRSKFNVPERIVLCVGTLEPRKNLPALIGAFKDLVDRDLNYSLVIVGRKGWQYAEIFQTLEYSGIRDRVIFLDYVPQTDLPFLYNAADLFVYPSLYEGFGLPVLEAMACGVPVITSNTSSMPEIAGDAGLLVDPHNTDEWADAMHRVLTDRALHAKLAQRGLERSKLFSWERTARETLAVYEHVV